MEMSRAYRDTERVQWVATVAVDLHLGDVLVAGQILAKAWGGPVGLDAWRFVVDGILSPLWLASDKTVLCRRARAQLPRPVVPGIVAGDPYLEDDRVQVRIATLTWARREIDRARARR